MVALERPVRAEGSVEVSLADLVTSGHTWSRLFAGLVDELAASLARVRPLHHQTSLPLHQRQLLRLPGIRQQISSPSN